MAELPTGTVTLLLADVQGAFPCPGADSPHGIRPGV